jgi:hypothetical protein
MGRKKIEKPILSPKEIRVEIRNYITQERDTIIKKWLALQEAVKLEDWRREEFHKRRLEKDTKQVPLTIRKFIGSLKKSVRKTMRDKGGTAYSIIRQMFIYWDADKSGDISPKELQMITNSLGIRISPQDIQDVVTYYDNGKGDNEMSYQELLRDIEDGKIDQHDGAYQFGLLLKQIYVDSALKKAEKLNEGETESEYNSFIS